MRELEDEARDQTLRPQLSYWVAPRIHLLKAVPPPARPDRDTANW